MTDPTIPPMKPNGVHRVNNWIRETTPWRKLYAGDVAALLEQAFRDGYAANDHAERMLAALREPSDEMLEDVAKAIYGKGRFGYVRGHASEEARRALAALHDLFASTETQAQEP